MTGTVGERQFRVVDHQISGADPIAGQAAQIEYSPQSSPSTQAASSRPRASAYGVAAVCRSPRVRLGCTAASFVMDQRDRGGASRARAVA